MRAPESPSLQFASRQPWYRYQPPLLFCFALCHFFLINAKYDNNWSSAMACGLSGDTCSARSCSKSASDTEKRRPWYWGFLTVLVYFSFLPIIFSFIFTLLIMRFLNSTGLLFICSHNFFSSFSHSWYWGFWTVLVYFSYIPIFSLHLHTLDVEVEGGVDFSLATRDPESGKLCVLEEKEVDTIFNF